MSAILTKPIVVPEYLNSKIRLYTVGAGGLPTVNAAYTIDLQTVLNGLFPGRTARPNCCKLLGTDLFVAQSSDDSQAILKFPNYLANPAAAVTNAFNFTFDGSAGADAYLDMAFDAAGNLYVAEDKTIVRYTGTAAATPPNGATNNNYVGKTVLGNAGAASFFANLAFDAAGNLWVSDYANNRLVVFGSAGLTQANTSNYHVLPNKNGSLAVANTDPTLKATHASFLFTSPEGVDFDAAGNLWVGNNNDFGNNPGIGNGVYTTLVKIPPALQAATLATPAGGALPAAQILPNVNCFIYNVPDGAVGKPQFGGIQVDRAGNRLYVNEEVDGKGRAYDLATIAATPATATDSVLAITSTNPGNGGLSLLQLGAYIADTTTDHGAEPDTTTTTPWESPSISVRQIGYSGAGLPPYQNPIGGRVNQVYVEVRNFSPVKTPGIEKLNLYWASASLGLSWPMPWDGALAPLGGAIALKVAIPVIPPSGSVIIGPIPWTTPNPADYYDDNGHFCLLARIVTPPFHDPAVADPMGLASDGMSVVEGPDIVANALANARIGWRNVTVLPAGTAPQAIMKFGAALDNYHGAAMLAALRFSAIDARGKVLPRLGGRVTITPVGPAAAAFDRLSGGHAGGAITLADGKDSLEGLTLQPGQHVPLLLGFVPDPPREDYALRVTQYAVEDGSERIVGGQTFVHGKVAGLPVAPTADPAPPSARPSIPRWLFLLLVALIALLLVGLLLK